MITRPGHSGKTVKILICISMLIISMLIVPTACKRNNDTLKPAENIQAEAAAQQQGTVGESDKTPEKPIAEPAPNPDPVPVSASAVSCAPKPDSCDNSWVCQDKTWTCAQPEGCSCNSKKYPARSVIKDNKVLCGEHESPEYIENYICLDGLMVCAVDKCQCGGSTISASDACIQNTPAFYNNCAIPFTRCKDPKDRNSEMWCGDDPYSSVIIEMDGTDWEFYKEYYTCENGLWVCRNPSGCSCGKAAEQRDGAKYLQVCDNGEIIDLPVFTTHKPSEPKLEKVEKCEKGNCKCGDGACANGAFCINGTCYCGYIEGILYSFTKQIGVTLITGNDYGEFSCDYTLEVGSSAGESEAELTCTRSNGCTTTITKTKYKKDDTVSGDTQGPENFNTSDLLRLCGRESADKIKLRTDTFDKFAKIFSESKGESTYFYVFNRDKKDIQFACLVRSVCDTWPVPRANRDQYVCDVGIEKDTFIQYESYISSPIGLRCARPEGCVCNASTCPNHAICTTNGCYFDSHYIRATCGVSPMMKSETQIIEEAQKAIKDVAESDYGMDSLIAPRAYVDALNNTAGISVKADGSCVCGNSTLLNPDLAQYTCDLYGYRCTSPQGCACGSVTCAQNAWCLQPDMCTKQL